jgi:pSer/pThr/pTyr-binding forkhead associated (FHA) protein
MRVELVGVGSRNPGQKLVLDALPAIIGREGGGDVVVEDSWVSRFQCMIGEEAGLLEVWDLGSRTGTFVNGRRIQKVPLRPGDKLTIGRSEFEVRYEPREAGSPAGPSDAGATEAAAR